MDIKILGAGCAKCRMLEEHTKKAIEEMGLSAKVYMVEDMNKIIEYGIWKTPGLVVDEQVVSSGHLLTIRQIKEILSRTK